MSIASRLPESIRNRLFGEREKFGTTVVPNDPDWLEWIEFYYQFYQDTQKRGVSRIVNHSGYQMLKAVSLNDKVVFEIGPGDLPHVAYWIGKPAGYFISDIRKEFLAKSQGLLESMQIPVKGYQIDSPNFPVEDQSVDIIIAFYVLEHLNPLTAYLNEMKRILKPGGLLIGGIPTEGGLGWGIGRYFSSRRYIKKMSHLNPDKIICWEHPNFAQVVLDELDEKMNKKIVKYWPLGFSNLDFNLIIRFMYQKP